VNHRFQFGDIAYLTDCSALAESLLESELFGHTKGAFTGAVADKRGLFEVAGGGTCFLDEIGEVSPGVQARLLRVLQERDVRRVGGTDRFKVDVRVIAATNKDLGTLVAERKFREDLFYRLSVVTISLPPLRERREDIPLLAGKFLDAYGVVNDRPACRITPEAMALLVAYDWPGNVRELQHAVEQAAALSSEPPPLPGRPAAEARRCRRAGGCYCRAALEPSRGGERASAARAERSRVEQEARRAASRYPPPHPLSVDEAPRDLYRRAPVRHRGSPPADSPHRR
jgi:transcriptional regulator with GAF, ATPase, and Fis domain